MLSNSIVRDLVVMANHLDSKGLVKEASVIDSLLKVAEQQKANLQIQYKVGKGDTWWSITKEHSPGRTAEENAALNDMHISDIIKPCQMLKIWGTPEAEGTATRVECP